MQTPINRHGVTFSHNIEILRDIADTIGIHNMVNGYDRYSWAVTEGGCVQIMISNHSSNIY